MAEMDTSSGGGHKKGPGVKKSKKLSTRVDLTPMVDLGFLLLTFFIFTTTMSTPTAFDLPIPADENDLSKRNKVEDNNALTILLGKENHVYYYEGKLAQNADGSTNLQSASYTGEKGIRDVIINAKKRSGNELVVIIKPTKESTYKNFVDILDEMQINLVERKAVVDVLDIEQQLIDKTEGS